MKLKSPRYLFSRSGAFLAIVIFAIAPAHAALWNGPDNGNFGTAANWSDSALPNGVIQINNGTAAVNTQDWSLTDLRVGQLGTSLTNGYIHNGGTITLTGNLALGTAPGTSNFMTINDGAIRGGKIVRFGNTPIGTTPSTNLVTMNGGTLEAATELGIGSQSSSATFNFNGGTITPTAAIYVGYQGGTGVFNQGTGQLTSTGTTLRVGTFGASGTTGGNGTVNLSGSAGFDVGTSTIFFGDGNNGNGTLQMSGNSVFTASGGSSIFFADGSNTRGQLIMADNAQFIATTRRLIIGQFGAGAAASLTISGNALLNVPNIIVGNANNASASNGTIFLNGGTIFTGSIRKGTSTLTPNADQIKLDADGGTLKVKTDAANSNFLQTVYLTLKSGGLKVDTNGNATIFTNNLRGPGGLTKLGDGTLTFNTTNTSYEGNTLVSQGTLLLKGPILSDTAAVTLNSPATGEPAVLNLNYAGTDFIGSLVLDGVTQPTGKSYGAEGSGADIISAHFLGTGILRVTAPSTGRTLTWTGNISNAWDTVTANFIDAGNNPATFAAGDHVVFNNPNATPLEVAITGLLEPDGVTFSGTGNITLLGEAGGIIGTRGIVKNGSGLTTLGGSASAFVGPISVNAGTLKMGDNKAFGASSGITIANGAQVDINGQQPGSIYNYTIFGTGPEGSGLIVNTGAGRFGNAGIKNLTLTADATIGGSGRFDIGEGGVITGNGHTLTKIGTADMSFRGNASGTPIHYIITAGRAWTEGTDNGLGGATGTVTVNAGAFTGTYGARTVVTPVTLLPGAGLANLGAGNSSWSNVTLSGGSFILDSSEAAYTLSLPNPLNGNASLTKIGIGTVLVYKPGYTGNTTVTAGTLGIAEPTLSDTGHVTIAESAFLDLYLAQQDNVASLTLGTTATPADTIWGSPANLMGAPNTTPLLLGAGTLRTLGTSVPANNYSSWASQNGLSGPAGLPGADFDGDGLKNGIEYVLGTLPNASDLTNSPKSILETNHLVFTFRRTAASLQYSPHVQYSADLTTWKIAANGEDAIAISSAPDDDEANIDIVTVRIPRSLGLNGKLFARLRVEIPTSN